MKVCQFLELLRPFPRANPRKTRKKVWKNQDINRYSKEKGNGKQKM
jgi:hypothetical protein